MAFGDVPHDGETEAEAAAPMLRSRVVSLEERLEHPAKHVRLNAGTVVETSIANFVRPRFDAG